MKRSAALSIVLGIGLAVALWLSMVLSDAVFQSRLLPWVTPLIYAQDLGFRVATRLFPCQMEGSDLGCEAYKWLPAFIGANAFVYSIVLLPIVQHWRKRNAQATRLDELARKSSPRPTSPE
jgi:hypothetical protein